MSADQASRTARLVPALATLFGIPTLWLPVAGISVAGLITYTYNCDDSCDHALAGWTHAAGSWQWSAQFFVFALPALVSATLTLAFLAAPHPRRAAVALTATLLLVAGWFAFPALSGVGWPALPVSRLIAEISGISYFLGDKGDWPYAAAWLACIGGTLAVTGETIALTRHANPFR